MFKKFNYIRLYISIRLVLIHVTNIFTHQRKTASAMYYHSKYPHELIGFDVILHL